jgi:hypothetical protein
MFPSDPSPVSAEPPEARFRLPHWGWFLLAAIVLAVVGIGVSVWLPYRREQRIAEKIQSLGGSVSWNEIKPDGMPSVVQERLPVWNRISSASFYDKVTDAELDRLKWLTDLKYLDLDYTQVNDAGVERLKGLTSLVELELVNTQITDAGLKHLQGLKSLGYLHLDNTQVTDTGLEYLKELHNLVALHLSETQVTDIGLEHLAGLARLEFLSLKKTHVTDAGLKHLKGLTALSHLRLSDTRITDAGLEFLKTTSIAILDLNRTNTTKEGRAMLRDALPDCRIEPNP